MPPSKWLELTVRALPGVDLVSSVLMEFGAGAVEEKEGALVTYLSPPSDVQGLLEALQDRLESLPGADGAEVTWRWQPHEDWEELWRRGLGLRRITARLLVAPSWEDVELREGEILLRIDPGLAFGTAEHATTRGCLRILDGAVGQGDRIADVGAGSGILSIAAARLGAHEVRAMEVDAMACETARENVERNGVLGRVFVEEVKVKAGESLPGAPFDGIVANLQTHLVLPLLPVLRSSLVPGGWIIVSGVFLNEEEILVPTVSRHDLTLQKAEKEDDWWTGLFTTAGPSK